MIKWKFLININNCQIDKTYPREGVRYITSSNIKYGNVIKILCNSILSDVFADFDPDVREEEQNDKTKNHCNQATEFKYLICIFFCITLVACPGIPQDLGWSYLWQNSMAGSRCLLSQRPLSKIFRWCLTRLWAL